MNPYKTRSKRRKAPPDGAYRCASKNRVIWHIRVQTGAYLVEMLVALLLATIITATLYEIMATNFRLATQTQNEIFANNLISELSNFTQGLSFDALKSIKEQGTTFVLMEDGVSQPNPIHLNPLQLEDTKFPGNVSLSIDDGPEEGQLVLTIDVNWRELEATKKKSTRIAVFQGINGEL